MSPNSVSAVLEKLIRRLCLEDFPCRYTTQVRLNYQLFFLFLCVCVCQMYVECLFSAGQLRCARRGQMIALARDREKTAEEELRRRRRGALLDLLRCPHSPWHQDHSWSPQAASLRELTVQAPQRLHANFVYSFFTTLCILEKDVSFFFLFLGGGDPLI